MKQLLLATAFSTASFAALFSQDCSLPAANYCLDAKFICGYALQGYQGNNAGYQPAPDIPGFGMCGSFHNPQFFQIVPCDEQFSLIVQSSNCLKGDGLQLALAESCDGPVISCDGGFSGGAGFPLWLGANVIPGEPYVLIIDGYLGDECDFIIEDVQGVDLTPPNNAGVAQPGSITFQPFGCGGGMLSVKLPTCMQNSSQGCEQGWASFYQNNCWQLNWNLPAGTEIVSPNPNAFTITVQFNQPVVNGAVSVSFDHLCPGINPGECSECIPGCCSPLPSITISSPPPCLYGPPNCQNFNLPAPLADSCHLAPYFSGGCLDGYCSTTAGLTPDQPTTTTDTIPEFENNGWLRVAPCKDSIAIDFQVFDCQTGDELGFFLLSGSCDTMTLLSFISAKEGETAHLTANNLTPGEVYFLAIDGFYNAECKFQAHVLEGFGIEPDTATCSNCTPSVIDGPSDLCPGDFATYTFTPGGCDITFSGGNGQLCTPPDVCQLQSDTSVLHWSIPTFMNFVGDSVGVFTITVQVDTNLIGIDTMLTGQVNAFWAPVPSSGGGSGGGGNIFGDDEFCGCTYVIGPCISPIIPLDVTVHHDVEIDYCELTCVQPCCSHGGQSYCSPGTYIVSQTNCLTKKLIVTSDANIPFADAGPTGFLNCIIQSATLVGNSSSGPNFTYAWSGPGLPGFSQNQQNITVALPGTYTLVVTNTSNGCTASDNTLVAMDITPPTVTIPPVPKVCYGEEVTLAANANPSFAQYAWSNGMTGQQITFYPNANSSYTVTVTNLSNGCTKTATATVQVLPPLQTYLPPQTICEGECVNVAGEEFCSGGNFIAVAESYLGCDSLISFVIIVKPYVVTNHGTVGTLTCDVTSISFMGNTYNQPGPYVVPESNGCGEHQFMIGLNNSPPYLEAGQPQEICVGQTATLAVSPILPSVEYIWSNGATGPQIEVSPTTTTTYTVIAQNYDNGCASADQVTVTVNQTADTDLGVVGTLNCAQPEISIFGNVYDQPGQYSVPKPDGCGNNLFVILGDLTPPWCPVIPMSPICAGESVTLQTAPPIPSNLQYLWNTGETTQEITVTPLVTTTYSVIATNPANGCSSVSAVTVEVNQPQIVQLGQVGTLTCAQPCLTFNGAEYCQPGTYSVTENCEIKEFQIGQDLSLPTVQLGQVGTLTCAQPCFTFNGAEYCQPGTYSVTENCEIREFEVGVLPPVWLELGEDQTIAAGESAELQAQTNAQPAVITWHNPTGPMPEANLGITVQPAENTLYSLEIQDVNGCLLEDSVWVLVKKAAGEWFAPNVIKPGAAGLNGWFTLFASPGHIAEIQLLEIYDRWGNLVFTRKNFSPNAPEMGWDGTQSGEMLAPAVFVWHAVLLLDDGNTEKVKGDVTVVR